MIYLQIIVGTIGVYIGFLLWLHNPIGYLISRAKNKKHQEVQELRHRYNRYYLTHKPTSYFDNLDKEEYNRLVDEFL